MRSDSGRRRGRRFLFAASPAFPVYFFFQQASDGHAPSPEQRCGSIRFSADEELSIIEISDADPAKEDRIMCVGNPESEWFAVSYGKVTSGIEKFGEDRGFPSNAMRHSAYIHVGSSGGAAIGEDMKLVGITPGASLPLDGKTFKYGVLIPVSEIRICLNEWDRQ